MENLRLFDLQQVFSKAVDECTPEIEAMMDSKELKRRHLVIALIGKTNNGGKITHKCTFGDVSEYEYDYMRYAVAKAEMSFRTKMSGTDVLRNNTHLICVGDPMYLGGVYFEEFDFAIGTSGADQEKDEKVSEMIGDKMIELMEEAVKAAIAGDTGFFEAIAV